MIETSEKKAKRDVLVIGGTGKLGGMIAKAVLSKGHNLRLLVRPGSRSKLPTELAKTSEIFESEDSAFHGVDTVVSAIQGGPETIIDAQLRFLRASVQAGVRRFIPSDFSFNLFNLAEGENINSDWRRQFAERADQERGNVEIVHVMNGCFLDREVLFGFLGAFNLKKNEAYLWGDGHEPMEFTTFEDTAAYTAEAAIDDASIPKKFFIAADTLNFHELVSETEAGLGRALSIKRLGTLAEMDSEIARRQQAEPRNIFSWLPMMYWRAMLSGKGKLGPLMNARYPSIHPTNVRAYVEKMTNRDA